MKTGLTLLLLLACVGCGANPRPGDGTPVSRTDKLVSVAQVTRAFEASGLRRVTGLAALFENSSLGSAGGLKTQYWSTRPAAFVSPPVIVEIFPSLQLARLDVSVGGDIENKNGDRIAPFPRVANVVVTASSTASRTERSDVQRALASLRKTQ